MKLPPRKDYPDYYEIIKKPIDITKIVNRIEDGKVKILTHSQKQRDYKIPVAVFGFCGLRKRFYAPMSKRANLQ